MWGPLQHSPAMDSRPARLKLTVVRRTTGRHCSRQVRGAYALLVDRSAMVPALEPGDTALINPPLFPRENMTALFLTDGDGRWDRVNAHPLPRRNGRTGAGDEGASAFPAWIAGGAGPLSQQPLNAARVRREVATHRKYFVASASTVRAERPASLRSTDAAMEPGRVRHRSQPAGPKQWQYVVVVCLLTASPASAAPANTLGEVVPALSRCWRAPSGTAGSELTIALALNRTGQIFGRPRITYSKLTGATEAHRRFVHSVLTSLARCTPISITPRLGEAIAGRRFAIRFRSTPRERGA
jgi:hypothetical protein